MSCQVARLSGSDNRQVYGITARQTLDITQLCRILAFFKQQNVNIRRIALQPAFFTLEFILPSDNTDFCDALERLWEERI